MCRCFQQPQADTGVDFIPAVYNTLQGGGRSSYCRFANHSTEDGAVIRCPECSAEIDVDEDEVEEGEILSCPECESELEVSQTHPVHLNLISDDLDEEDDEEEEGGIAENGDLLDEDEEDDEEEDEK
jgi:alpha-aminoadipate/glutamate carrier protein LysW